MPVWHPWAIQNIQDGVQDSHQISDRLFTPERFILERINVLQANRNMVAISLKK